MSIKSSDYSARQHCGEIVCSHCGRTGTILWDDVTRRNTSPWQAPEPAGFDGPFFERLSKTAPYPIELVCRSCGGVAMTAYPSTSLHAREAYN